MKTIKTMSVNITLKARKIFRAALFGHCHQLWFFYATMLQSGLLCKNRINKNKLCCRKSREKNKNGCDKEADDQNKNNK